MANFAWQLATAVIASGLAGSWAEALLMPADVAMHLLDVLKGNEEEPEMPKGPTSRKVDDKTTVVSGYSDPYALKAALAEHGASLGWK
jgi:hypothetical protein